MKTYRFLREPAYSANRKFNLLLNTLPPVELRELAVGLMRIDFGGGRKESGKITPWHTHQDLQVQIVLSGRFTYRTRSDRVTLVPGQGILVLPKLEHLWKCEAEGLVLGLYLEITGGERANFLSDLQRLSELTFIRFRDPRPYLFSDAVNTVHSSSPLDRHLAKSLLTAWVLGILETATPLGKWKPMAYETFDEECFVDAARSFIRQNYWRRLTTDQIAMKAGISLRQLNRLFRRYAKITPRQYLEDCRLEHARHLLSVHHDWSVKSVTFESGFSSPSYFAERFKRKFALLPRDIRSKKRIGLRRA